LRPKNTILKTGGYEKFVTGSTILKSCHIKGKIFMFSTFNQTKIKSSNAILRSIFSVLDQDKLPALYCYQNYIRHPKILDG